VFVTSGHSFSSPRLYIGHTQLMTANFVDGEPWHASKIRFWNARGIAMLVLVVIALLALPACYTICATASLSELPDGTEFFCIAAEDDSGLVPLRMRVGNFAIGAEMNPWEEGASYIQKNVEPYSPCVRWKSSDRYAVIARSKTLGWTAWWWDASEVRCDRTFPFFTCDAVRFDFTGKTPVPLTRKQRDQVHADYVDRSLDWRGPQ